MVLSIIVACLFCVEAVVLRCFLLNLRFSNFMRSIRLDGMGFILCWFRYVTDGNSGDDGNIARVSVVYIVLLFKEGDTLWKYKLFRLK